MTIAWIPSPSELPARPDFDDDDPLQPGPFQPFFQAGHRNAEAVVVRYLEVSLSIDEKIEGYERLFFSHFGGTWRPRQDGPFVLAKVQAIYSDTVVIQRSPVSEVPFKDLTKGASSVTIGAYLGTKGVPPDASPMLLFASVPFGIVVIGTAMGLAKGLENGLQKYIAAKFTQASKPRPRTPPSRSA